MSDPNGEGTEPVSRRRLLQNVARAGAVGAGAAVLTGAVAEPAHAGSDGDVVLGANNQLTSGTTGVQSSADTGLHGVSTLGGGSGVVGECTNPLGVGVSGLGAKIGVVGESSTGSGPGVLGGTSASSGDGVEGQTIGASNSGVYGHNESSTAGGKGVFGASPNGIAVEGLGGQIGVHGVSAGGTAVQGQGGGVGVHAVSTLASNSGVGLLVDGRSIFRTAGIATVASGQNKVVVTLAGVTTSDFVIATAQGNPSGMWVKSASAASGSFTIRLNKAPTAPATVKVAYFVNSAS